LEETNLLEIEVVSEIVEEEVEEEVVVEDMAIEEEVASLHGQVLEWEMIQECQKAAESLGPLLLHRHHRHHPKYQTMRPLLKVLKRSQLLIR